MGGYVDPKTGMQVPGATFDDAWSKGYVYHPPPTQPKPVSIFPSVPTYTPPPSYTPPSPSYRSNYSGASATGIGYGARRASYASVSSSAHTFNFAGFAKLLGWMLLSAVLALVGFLGYKAASFYGERALTAQPTQTGAVYVYPASELTKFRWLHRASRPMHLDGRTVIVIGDVTDAYINANGNIAFRGSLTNVNVIDRDWTVTAQNAKNSTITARQIVITNHSENTKTIVVPGPIASTKPPKRKHRQR